MQLFKIEHCVKRLVVDLQAVEDNRRGLLPVPSKCRKRIATHCKPDTDAFVSVWLAERFLFESEAEMLFVPYSEDFSDIDPVDCVVDMSGLYDPHSLLLNRKQSAFEDRCKSCATRLIWEELLKRVAPVFHLERLVRAIHAGDSVRHRGSSQEYAVSKREGFHAAINKEKRKGNLGRGSLPPDETMAR